MGHLQSEELKNDYGGKCPLCGIANQRSRGTRVGPSVPGVVRREPPQAFFEQNQDDVF